MATFLLKKYEQEKNTNSEQESEKKPDDSVEQKNDEEVMITVSGSISEIVATALQKVFKNKVNVIELSNQEEKSTIKAITTENINNNPLLAFKSVNKNDIVFIHNTGFKTVAEEWFLTNITNKTSTVFYTLESFVNFIKTKF